MGNGSGVSFCLEEVYQQAERCCVRGGNLLCSQKNKVSHIYAYHLTSTSYRASSRHKPHSAIKHRLSPLSFLICIRRKLRLPIYPPNTRCRCGHHDHDVFGDHAFCCDKGSKKRTHNTIAADFAIILSPALALAGYIYPNTKLDIEMHLHLQSDPTARPFDISFNPNPYYLIPSIGTSRIHLPKHQIGHRNASTPPI
jgi:hypothetical protein